MHKLQETKEERYEEIYRVDIEHIAMIGAFVRSCPSLSNAEFNPQQFFTEFGASLAAFPTLTFEEAGVLFNQLLLPEQLEKLSCNFIWGASKQD